MGTSRLLAILMAAGMLTTACGGGTAPPQAQTPASSQPAATAITQSAPATQTQAATSVPTTLAAATSTAVPATVAASPAAASPTKPAATTPSAAGMSNLADCGTDLGCFIEASRAGRLAKVDYTMAVDFFGMFLANTDTLAIKGKEGANLLFSQQTIAADATLSEAVVKTAQAKGMSEADLQTALTTAKGIAELIQAASASINLTPDAEKQLKAAKENQQARIGTGKECKFPQPALTAMLERWQKGQYSSSDYDPAQCSNVTGTPGASTSGPASTAVPTKSAATPTRTATPMRTATPTRTPTPVAQGSGARLGANLIVNGNAEAGTGATSTADVAPPPGWTVSGNFTAIKYGTAGVLATNASGPANRGTTFFAGGPDNELSSASQTIDVSTLARDIDAGRIRFMLAGYIGGRGADADSAMVTATFKGADGEEIGGATIGPSIPETRGSRDGLKQSTISGMVPRNTRSIEVTVTMKRVTGEYNDGYADNLELVLRGPSG